MINHHYNIVMSIASVAIVVLVVGILPGAAQDLVITNARILDGTGSTIDAGSIVVRDGRIASISPGRPSETAGLTEIDAEGMTAMPGLIDTHVHLMANSLADTDEAVERYVDAVVADVLESLLERGLTTIMSPGDHFPNILELRRRLADGEMNGPRLLAVGPVFAAPDDHPTQVCGGNAACKAKLVAEVGTREEARTKVRALAAAGVDAVKLAYDSAIRPNVRIEDDVVAALADEARLHGLTTFAHVSTPGEEPGLKLVALGIRGLVHPVSFRSTPDGAQTLRTLQIPVSTTISGSTREWIEPIRAFTERDEAAFTERLEDIAHLFEEGVTLAFGTDAQAVPDARLEARFLAEARALNRVMPNEQVLATLTRNAARYLELEDEIGTLESGKFADVVLINGDPLSDISDLANVEVVIQGGRVVADRR